MSRYSPELIAEVQGWAGLLLPGWEVVLMEEAPPGEDMEGTAAIMETGEHAHQIRVHITDEVLRTDDFSYRSRVIVHELLHPLMRPLRNQAAKLIDGLPEEAKDREDELLVHNEKVLVDLLSRILVPHRPIWVNDGA